MTKDPDGPGGAGNYYNSLGVVDDVPDEEFDARFRALDPAALRQEYGGDAIRFNGPRRFLGDRFTAVAFDGGSQSMLGPIPMYLYGTFVVPDFDAFIAGKQVPYHETVSRRTTTWFFDAGTEVYELVSPEGRVFVMQSASQMIDPDNSVDRLPSLSDRLALPEGWQFRARTLTEALVMPVTYADDPPNTVVLDEFENNYQHLRDASFPKSGEGGITMTENLVPASPAVLADGEGAVFGRVDGMHQARYIEMFLAGFDAKTGGVVAACYNPMFGEGGIPASRDTAPQALVEGIDYAKLKADYGLLGASLNGPKIWTPDWAEAQVGAVRDFNGIEAPWVGQLDMKKAGAVGDVAPYEPMTIARDSRIGWNKGTTVMLLDDADGNTWIMKGFQLGLEPRFTYGDFIANGAGYFEKLPAGWSFRVTTLDEELIETPVNGVATIMADEFFNIYDKSGPDQMSYKP